MGYNFMTADEAALFVKNGYKVGFSGFTAAGTPKEVPAAIARLAMAEHAKGNEYQISVFSGASTGDALDGNLARANAIKFRTPYQSNKDLRGLINSGDTMYSDMHLSHLAQELRYGFFGNIDVAVLEVADITDDGEIVLTAGVGIAPTLARIADKLIIELNHTQPKELKGMHDIYEPCDAPHRREIPIYSVKDRAGSAVVKIDPKKVVAVVETDCETVVAGFTPVDEVTAKDVCLHIASCAPEFVSREEIPQAVIDEETRIEMGKEDLANKPEQIRAKIVEGRVNKLMAQKCLIEQPFVKNPDQTIEQYISGKFSIVKFDRFVLGEGLEKRNENFADEVMSQIAK